MTSKPSTLLLLERGLFCKVPDGCWSWSFYSNSIQEAEEMGKQRKYSLLFRHWLHWAGHFYLYPVCWLDHSPMATPSCKRGWKILHAQPQPQTNLGRFCYCGRRINGYEKLTRNPCYTMSYNRHDLVTLYPVILPDKALKIRDFSEISPVKSVPQILPSVYAIRHFSVALFQG